MVKRFEGQNLFTNVNLKIQDHSRIALIGRNGVGKSTLVKMLIGQLEIDGGNVSLKNGLRVGYLAQNTGLHSNRTIKQEMESVFSGIIKEAHQIHHLETEMGDPKVISNPAKLKAISKVYDQMQDNFNRENGYGYKAEIRGVLHGFGFTAKDYNRNINDLSGGQQSQLALAKLLLEKRDLLILDEPTNHIDVKTVTWLENYLKNYPGAIFVVSHDRYFLDKVVNEVYLLSGGTTHHYYGNYTQFKHEQQKRYKLNMRAYRKQQAKVHRDKEFIKKNIARASTSRRAQSRRKQLAKLKLMPRPVNNSKVARFRFNFQRASGEAVLTVRNLKVGYHNQVVAGPLSFSVRRQEAIGIIGPNGIGKSTLLRTIIHNIPKISGSIQFGTGVTIGYYDQKQATLHPDKTVLHELWDEHPNTDEGVIRSILGSFLFSGDEVNKQVSQLSGGEKARLQLTKLSMQHSNFLLLDEPTNHLDIASREVLENALRHFQGTILFVSHDRYFINKIATAIIELSSKGAKLYLGNYDYYVAKKDEERAIKAHQQQKANANQPKTDNSIHTKITFKSKAQRNYVVNKKIRSQKRKLTRQVQALEKQINHFDQVKQAIEVQMTKPANLKNPKKLNQLQKQIDQINQKSQQIEEQWEVKGTELEERFK